MDNAQVTEADRKAYLALNMLPEKYREAIMAGEWDSTTGMQVLARHRLERSEPVGWMGIDSAPKDGTRILVSFGNMGVREVAWLEPENASFEIWCVDDNKHGPFALRGWSDHDGSLNAPTDWQPLPPAPGTTPPEPVAEIERLRGALVSIARETVGVVPEVLNLQMCIHTVNDVARAALGDAS